MRKPRGFITKGGGPRHFHVVSRIVNRDFVLGHEEKEFFRRTMRKLETFTGVKILTYCVMSNHFHLLIKVPDPTNHSDEEVCQRMGVLYSKLTVAEFRKSILKARRDGDSAFAEQLRNRITCRMYDLSSFMKDLKQRFTQWYNRRHARRGTLWEERYRALLVEGSDHALLTIATYIDLNPVRAGICDNPKDYQYCGYSEASGGHHAAREGLKSLLVRYDGILSWQQAAKEYRRHLFEVELGSGLKEKNIRKNHNRIQYRSSNPTDSVRHLNQCQLLRCRIRYFTDGVVLGSRSFVDQFFVDKRKYFGPNRKSGARKIKGCRPQKLYTARDLQLNRFN